MDRKIDFTAWFKGHWLFSWPLTALVLSGTFGLVFLTVLPYVNAIGYAAFWDSTNSALGFNFFLAPFTALDCCILLGYFKLARRMAKSIDRGCERLFAAAREGRAAKKVEKPKKKAAKVVR